MIITTANELTAAGFVLERGAGERIQFWRAQNSTGRDEGRIFDSVAGRCFKVGDDGRERAVIVACATVCLAFVEASGMSAAIKAAAAKVVTDALAGLK